MKSTHPILRTAGICLLFVTTFLFGSCVGITMASGLTGDPVCTVAAPSSVQAGTPITFTATIDQPGFAPTNGSQKITARFRSGSTLNVANYTVIPMTFDGTAWTFTYTPNASEVTGVSRLYETFSATVPVSQARIPRTISCVSSFYVTAS